MQEFEPTLNSQDKIGSRYFWGRFFTIALLIIGSWHFLFADRAVIKLKVKVEKSSYFKIYYRSHSQEGWSAQRVKQIYLRPHRDNYSFRFVNIKNVAEIRIDPTEKNESGVTITSLQIKQKDLKPINLFTEENIPLLQRGIDIKEFSVEDNKMKIVSSGNDPQFFFMLPKLKRAKTSPLAPKDIILNASTLCVLLILAFLLVYGHQHFISDYRYVIGGFLIVLTLASVVAGISKYNKHPDEFVHVAAAKYYMHNTVPPAVGDLRAEGTYSHYGYSRLFNINGAMAYMLGGKFAALLKPLHIPEYIALRYFNITLLAILFICALCNITWRILLVPLLLSPQIWYIFSYFNSDAFSFFLCLWLAWEIVAPNSAWNKFIDKDDSPFEIFPFLRLCFLTVLLLFCKKNFYFIGIYATVFFAWQYLFHKKIFTKRSVIYAASMGAVVFSLFCSYHLWDASINDFHKKERVMEQVEKHAKPLFNPKTPKDKQFYRLYMKDKGFPLQHLIAAENWFELTFRSSIGEYGYANVQGSHNYYDYMRCLLIGMLIIAGLYVTFFMKLEGVSLFTLTLSCGLALIGVSLYHSWTNDFQAQGRYLLPFVAMVSIFYYQCRTALNNTLMAGISSMIFIGSIYSFIFVLIAGIDKLQFPFN